MKVVTGIISSFALVTMATGEVVPWVGSGTVTSVAGSGFLGVGVSQDDPVIVRFSYNTNAPVALLSDIPLVEFRKTGYGGNEAGDGDLGLQVTIEIGGLTWSGSLGAPGEFVYPLVLEDSRALGIDIFTADLKTTDAAKFAEVFSSFPGAGGTSALHKIFLRFADAASPPDFLTYSQFGGPTPLPGVETDVCQITSATGEIAAGSDKIRFSIDPLSIVIGPSPSAGTPVPVMIETSGAGVELRWDSTLGKRYEIQRSCHLQSWSVVDTHDGTDAELAVSLPSFTADLDRQFYQVVELD